MMKTILSLILLTTLKVSAALQMSGAGQWINSPVNAFVAPSNLAFTASMWIKVAGNHQNGQAVITCRMSGASGWLWQISDADRFELYVYAPINMYRDSANSVVTRNKWQHVVVTWDGLTVIAAASPLGMHFYVNGVETAYAAGANGGVPLGNPASAPFTFGNRPFDGSNFNGQICEAAIWTNVLNSAEIAKLAAPVMRTPLMVRKEHLVGYWPMVNGPDGSTTISIVSEIGGRNDTALTTAAIPWTGSPFGYR